MPRFSGKDERRSLDMLYLDYAAGSKNPVTVDLSKIKAVDVDEDDPQQEQNEEPFIIRFFGQIVLDPKPNYLLVAGSYGAALVHN